MGPLSTCRSRVSEFVLQLNWMPALGLGRVRVRTSAFSMDCRATRVTPSELSRQAGRKVMQEPLQAWVWKVIGARARGKSCEQVMLRVGRSLRVYAQG